MWILLYAACLHLIWGILILVIPQHIGATPLALFHNLIGIPIIEGCVYITVALCTIIMLTCKLQYIYSLAFGLPQQIILIISACSSLLAVWNGHYADYVTRHWAFIFADQLPNILTAIIHTFSLIIFHGGLRWMK